MSARPEILDTTSLPSARRNRRIANILGAGILTGLTAIIPIQIVQADNKGEQTECPTESIPPGPPPAGDYSLAAPFYDSHGNEVQILFSALGAEVDNDPYGITARRIAGVIKTQRVHGFTVTACHTRGIAVDAADAIPRYQSVAPHLSNVRCRPHDSQIYADAIFEYQGVSVQTELATNIPCGPAGFYQFSPDSITLMGKQYPTEY